MKKILGYFILIGLGLLSVFMVGLEGTLFVVIGTGLIVWSIYQIVWLKGDKMSWCEILLTITAITILVKILKDRYDEIRKK